MIIYHDTRKIPLFAPYFESNGEAHENIYHSKFSQLLFTTPASKLLPSWCFFRRPALKKGDSRIIVFDSKAGARYLNWLAQKNPDKRVILWFWNPVPASFRPEKLNPGIELWTYSEADSKRYGFRRNSQFFFDSLADLSSSPPQLSPDGRPVVSFVGREKSRGAQLRELERQLLAEGAEPRFTIIPNLKEQKDASLWESLLPYKTVVETALQSHAILDYSSNPEAGLSLRPMEALFFRRKLITNCLSIRNEPFYDRHNIYLLGQETRSIRGFLNEPMHEIPAEIRDYYLFSNWLKRFD